MMDPDVFRFLFLVIAAFFYGGVAHMIWRYHHRPPAVSIEQRRRFVYGALMGGTLLVTALAVDVAQHQGRPLRPATVLGGLGVLVLLLTMWRLLHNAKDGDRR